MDSLTEEMDCMYLSDLLYIGKEKRDEMALLIRNRYPADSVPLTDWNSALSYLFKCSSENTADTARERLIELLENGIV